MELKNRRITLDLDIQADSMEELAASLRGLAFQMEKHVRTEPESGHTMVSGGCGSGYIGKITVDKNMDAAKYREALAEYMEKA